MLNHSPFEQFFSLSEYMNQNFPLLLIVIVASGLLLCTSVKSLPPSFWELPLRNLKTELRAPNALSPLLSRLNKPPVSLCTAGC